MNRRKFIQTISTFAALGSLGTTPPQPTRKITVLHTNDVHSHIEPFPADHRFANRGGIARRTTLIEAIRAENPNTLLLDAGDIFQGTPYFNFYGGELEFKLMSLLKYDAATIGNHDFDAGIDGLQAQLPNAQFSFISSNYDFSNTVMDGRVKPYQVFIKDGIKVGVYGLGIELKGLVKKDLYKETRYLNPIEISQDMERLLKEEKHCDLVICLSHLGYYYRNQQLICDLRLAEKTRYTDLIIGGHTHTFLKKPTVVKNALGKNMLINQVGCYGLNVGKVDFYFAKNHNHHNKGTSIIV